MKFEKLLADPPWKYNSYKTGGNMISGAMQKYNTMEACDILNLPVKKHVAKNAVLFFWVTTPMMVALEPSPSDIMRAWGFKPKTAIYWIKDDIYQSGRLGLGNWFRGNVEICMFATRGKVKPLRSNLKNYFFEKPQQHSKKPEGIFAYINKFDMEPSLELFCRGTPKDGWYGWGNQCTLNHYDIFGEGI